MLRPIGTRGALAVASRPQNVRQGGGQGSYVSPVTAPAPPPNGPYASAPWSIDGLTETTGQADPFGGTTASLLTDTAVNALHRFFHQSINAGRVPYRARVFFKPNTFTGGITVETFTNTFEGGMICSNTGVAASRDGNGGECIESKVLGNGWIQLEWVMTSLVGIGGSFLVLNFGQAGQQAYLGTGASQWVWGLSITPVYS